MTAFATLQSRLGPLWPDLGHRSSATKPMVAVPSFGLALTPDVARSFGPLLPAYEERLLVLLLLLDQPAASLIYVTSQPVHPRVVDYYLSLLPGLDTPATRSRLRMVSLGDPSPRPLSEKLLERPRTLDRIRRLLGDAERAHLIPFVTTTDEVRLAVQLGVPLFGASPSTLAHGTKSGSRALFEAEGVPSAPGVNGVRTMGDVVEAILSLRARGHAVREAVVKLDDGFAGLGNARLDLRNAKDRGEVRACVRHPSMQDGTYAAEAFFVTLGEQGGVVEEHLLADVSRSPSVQLRISPLGEVEVLSTHDQILGGSTGQVYEGAVMPASREYAGEITQHAVRVGRRLAEEGVVGRFAVDFLALRHDDGGWDVRALEVNLRKGGTTHPLLALELLSAGRYDAATATFLTRHGSRCYLATDRLTGPRFDRLTVDDVLDLLPQTDLGWNPDSDTGTVLHMLSALPATGRLGATVVGTTTSECRALHDRLFQQLTSWAAFSGPKA